MINRTVVIVLVIEQSPTIGWFRGNKYDMVINIIRLII